jgi:hypothetical protein
VNFRENGAPMTATLMRVNGEEEPYYKDVTLLPEQGMAAMFLTMYAGYYGELIRQYVVIDMNELREETCRDILHSETAVNYPELPPDPSQWSLFGYINADLNVKLEGSIL